MLQCRSEARMPQMAKPSCAVQCRHAIEEKSKRGGRSREPARCGLSAAHRIGRLQCSLRYETIIGDPRFEFLRKGGRELSRSGSRRLGRCVGRLDQGLMLSMPLSRPMPSIGRGVHELRFRDRSGIYRVIYFLRKQDDIWLVHAFKKRTQRAAARNIEVARQRIRWIS